MKLNGSDIFCEVLLEEGVDTIFGYPGGCVLNLYDALYKYQDRIRHVLTAHEQGASHAADGYARASGKTGVVLATSGPGATNLVTGIATAYMDSIPMVAITGNVPRALTGKDSFQEVYIAGITVPITKHNFIVDNVEDLADTLRAAFRIASSGRKGPVLVDIPKDISALECEFEPAKPVRSAPAPVPCPKALQQAADLINAARRPVFYYGGGVQASGAEVALQAVMAKAGIPAVSTLMALGCVSSDNPLALGMIGMHGTRTANYAVEECDLLIAVGTRFSDRVALSPGHFAPDAKILHIDIDAAEINKNVTSHSCIVGDARVVLEALLPLVDGNGHAQWLDRIAQLREQDYSPVDSVDGLRPHQIMRTISALAGKDAIYATDVGQHQMWAAQFLHHVKPRHFLTSGGLGTMGYGYGAAIGAQVACPGQHVIHITGDGSFHMNMNEACTAVSEGLPVITVIVDNRVLGMVRQWQTAFYGKRYSSTTLDRATDYVKVAEGFGAKGYCVRTQAEFETAFAEALKSQGPVWIDCLIDRDDKVLPMIPGGGTVANLIMSE